MNYITYYERQFYTLLVWNLQARIAFYYNFPECSRSWMEMPKQGFKCSIPENYSTIGIIESLKTFIFSHISAAVMSTPRGITSDVQKSTWSVKVYETYRLLWTLIEPSTSKIYYIHMRKKLCFQSRSTMTTPHNVVSTTDRPQIEIKILWSILDRQLFWPIFDWRKGGISYTPSQVTHTRDHEIRVACDLLAGIKLGASEGMTLVASLSNKDGGLGRSKKLFIRRIICVIFSVHSCGQNGKHVR